MIDFNLDDLLKANNGTVYLNMDILNKLGISPTFHPCYLNIKIMNIYQDISQLKEPVLLRYPLDTEEPKN